MVDKMTLSGLGLEKTPEGHKKMLPLLIFSLEYVLNCRDDRVKDVTFSSLPSRSI